MKDIQIVAFDADDTLWHNEHYFQETEQRFATLLADYLPQHAVLKELYQKELENLHLYGYGIKSFMLSMLETAITVSERTIPVSVIEKIIAYGREMLEKPVELLPGVVNVLDKLSGRYRLVLATKGDLLDQERKLAKSGLTPYFHHIEIMSEKKEDDYQKLIRRLDIQPAQLVMIGNSLKSDILPVLKLGGYGVHIPYHITWEHERVESEIRHERFFQCAHIGEVVSLIE